jgi:hypothetical protein
MYKYKFINTWSHFINETLKSHDIDLTIKKINRELQLLHIDFNIDKEDNKIFIKLNNFNNLFDSKLTLETTKRLMIDWFGWFPSTMIATNLVGNTMEYVYDEDFLFKEDEYHQVKYKNYTSIEIAFEPRYDKISNTPDKLYHLSIKHYKNSILKNGLSPRSKSKLSKHLDRIYVCTDPNYCFGLIFQMKLYYSRKRLKNSKYKIDSKWIIYEIDVNEDITLYEDPNFKNKGFYITDNIKPECIKIFKEE